MGESFMKMSGLDWIAWVLVIIGGLNWGLIGIFKWDLVAAIFGGVGTVVSRIIYTLVGLSALYLIATVGKMTPNE